MVKRDDLITYLADFLEVEAVSDACPNGLQVQGKEEVNKIVTSVSGSRELFKRAVDAKADMVIVHHGILWKGQDPVIRGSLKKRIQSLLDYNLNLLAYHLPLDRHPKVGNNILGAEGLGLKKIRPFGEYRGQVIGFCGRFPDKIDADGFFEQVNTFYNTKSLVFPFGPKEIESVGVISGGAQEDITEAVKEGLDCFITGEVSEYVMHLAREEKIHFISAGHYATERLGIRALGEHICDSFDVDVEFIDIPVPV